MKERKSLQDRFVGKVAIVTGGSSGIGWAVVEELCKEGSYVAFTGLSEIGLDRVKDLTARGFSAMFLRGDMADSSFCVRTVSETLREWGRVDFLVNNAFSFISKGMDATCEDWSRMFQVGPTAYAQMAAKVVEPMKRQGGGAIVNMSSISAYLAQPNRWTYCSAKGAVAMLTRCMALDFAKYNIRVNSVSPGWIWTRGVEQCCRRRPQEVGANLGSVPHAGTVWRAS